MLRYNLDEVTPPSRPVRPFSTSDRRPQLVKQRYGHSRTLALMTLAYPLWYDFDEHRDDVGGGSGYQASSLSERYKRLQGNRSFKFGAAALFIKSS